VEWIGLIVATVILLKVIGRGGGWFEFLDSEARYENWWTNFEFNAVFIGICLFVLGLLVWIYVQAAK
jgi:hypothetical protein